MMSSKYRPVAGTTRSSRASTRRRASDGREERDRDRGRSQDVSERGMGISGGGEDLAGPRVNRRDRERPGRGRRARNGATVNGLEAHSGRVRRGQADSGGASP